MWRVGSGQRRGYLASDFPASRQDPVHCASMGMGNRDLTQHYPEGKHIAMNPES